MDAQAPYVCLVRLHRTHSNVDHFLRSVIHENLKRPAVISIVRKEGRAYPAIELTEAVRDGYPEDEEIPDDKEGENPVLSR